MPFFLVSPLLANPTPAPSPQTPFALFESIPAQVDAAAVFNNPAEQFLLSDSGKSIRKLFAFAGLFAHTEHAFDALASTFNAKPDQIIESLFSRRVMVVWDDIAESSNSVFKFTNAIDTHWTLVCEVDPQYLSALKSHLKPVRRRIEQGHAVYAIEKGRYEIVLVDADLSNNRHAAVILAPKAGSKLLDRVLETFANTNPSADDQSTMRARNALADTLAITPDWSVAWILQPAELLASQSDASVFPNAIVGLITASPRAIGVEFATDYQPSTTPRPAPVGLLNAVGGDAILAIASSTTPNLFANSGLLNKLAIFTTNEPAPSAPSSFPATPGLILLSKIASAPDAPIAADENLPVALTMLAQLPTNQDQAQQAPAVRADRIMHDLIGSFPQSTPPNHQGRFPAAVRTYKFEPASPTGRTKKNQSWLGSAPKFSWLTSDSPTHPIMIVSLAPHTGDTVRQLRWIAEAAESLDALKANQPTDQLPDHAPVISMGFFKPAQAAALLDSASPMDKAFSNFIETISWKIASRPTGVAGSISLNFSNSPLNSMLGGH
jgi:hypothetical protein